MWSSLVTETKNSLRFIMWKKTPSTVYSVE